MLVKLLVYVRLEISFSCLLAEVGIDLLLNVCLLDQDVRVDSRRHLSLVVVLDTVTATFYCGIGVVNEDSAQFYLLRFWRFNSFFFLFWNSHWHNHSVFFVTVTSALSVR